MGDRKETTTAGSKALLLRMPPELYDRLVQLAGAEERSKSAQVRYLIEQRVKEFEAEATEAA